MIYNRIQDVPYSHNRTIIINVGTRFVTTLAVFSAMRNAGLPVLLIDCKFKDIDDWSYFKVLNEKYEFDLVSLPLKEHGQTLDHIFSNLKADNILLVDSDLDLKDKKIVPYMLSLIENPKLFGCGFRHGGWNIHGNIDYEEKYDGYYEERMWIPFVLLKTECIKKALSEGSSFNFHMFYNLFPRYQGISKKILHKAKGKLEFKFLDPFKKSFHGEKPLVVLFDTGADLYNHLRYKSHLLLAALDSEIGLEDKYLKHYNGITRRMMFNDPFNTCDINEEYESIRLRLLNDYNFDILNFKY